MSLPKVNTNVVQELQEAKSTINRLQEYQSKNWAIGLNGDTFQPDNFLTYFDNRDLAFNYYVQNKGVSIGNSTAYTNNINEVKKYALAIVESEVSATNKTISELENYKNNFWAIGLNGDSLQPDNFNNFFADRNIQFKPFVRNKGVEIGQESAYDENINALREYIGQLEDVRSTIGVVA
ncbi:hypothetical protein H0A36_03700 [Endozoicomonas sp. SM1973]|uniref:Uncharacterized protein n=1 Tax=Spartinivicinus marinus TaxID=2994442 RepID=A0A853HTK9_9GAMM|nr:hypothetical protein [Spartinivicinus marinus]MCX4029526.1 hypothetical protein [Spartinivicinus marinus]NYZ65100.1 hypothetical protein [Spartinivicinus marinus]